MYNKIFYRLGEIYSGPGGLAFGAINSKLRSKNTEYRFIHEWACDYDKDSCSTFIHNIEGANQNTVFYKDIKNLSIETLKKIDGFAYGFPCNDFSIVGERKGIKGNFGNLYKYGVQIIDYFKPIFFVAENVSGLKSANNGSAFRRIISELRNAGDGYHLSIHLYKSEDYGIPQTRHRIFIIGFAEQSGLFYKVPEPTTVNQPVSVRNVLENPPLHNGLTNNEITRQSETVIERLKHIGPGENAWTADLPEKLKLNVKSAKLSHIYKRLHPDKPSYTITGSGGGGTHVYHWSENRALTNRERARIQTFPDDFHFIGSKESVRKQIGMAVPPKLSQIIFTAVLKTLAGIEYESIPANMEEELCLF